MNQKCLDTSDSRRYDGQTAITLTSYQCKTAINVAVLNSLHPDILVSSDENPKKKPDSVCTAVKQKWEWTFMTK